MGAGRAAASVKVYGRMLAKICVSSRCGIGERSSLVPSSKGSCSVQARCMQDGSRASSCSLARDHCSISQGTSIAFMLGRWLGIGARGKPGAGIWIEPAFRSVGTVASWAKIS